MCWKRRQTSNTTTTLSVFDMSLMTQTVRRGEYKRQFLLRSSTKKRHFKYERVCVNVGPSNNWEKRPKSSPPFFQLAELVCCTYVQYTVQYSGAMSMCKNWERGEGERGEDFWGLSCNTSASLQLQHHGCCCCISIAVFLSCCLLKRHIFFLLFLMYCTFYAVKKERGPLRCLCAIRQCCTAA